MTKIIHQKNRVLRVFFTPKSDNPKKITKFAVDYLDKLNEIKHIIGEQLLAENIYLNHYAN